ncbi:FUSC family protein [Marinomonas pollencensis]|uniref:Putative membrane protein YccC n=1 Tax=Marinomonas pollencensis TaxID=491954 RepID=A0A3E0DTW7_9GAMM|nr:FUSC family protein [Marinomonas pollencensis]REG86870.1 putative membrane protein YccC [Marinomonas pollencensis]
MSAVFQALFLPERYAILFALKGVIAMAMALTIAMYLNLDRPYWALISAVFLQMRPEGGMVIEKAICQIAGTLIGGVVGILILNYFMPYPYLAIAIVTLWLGLNAAFSAMVRQANFIYGFAMAGVTAEIIVLLVMVSPATADSQAVFDVAQARVSEIVLGSICAALVSHLFWPVKVKHGLQAQSRSVINQTLNYLVAELALSGTHEQRHQHIDSIIQTLSLVSDDSSAVAYEGPEGPGRARAAKQISHKVLSLLAVIQIFGRLQRQHAEMMTPALNELLEHFREVFSKIAASDDFDDCYERVRALRKTLIELRQQTTSDQPFEVRMLTVGLDLTADLAVLLRAFGALENRDNSLLKAPSAQTHRDPLLGLVTGGRTAAIFLLGALIWISTGASAALMIMILPTIFSIMLARLPRMVLKLVLRRILVGVLVAIPVAIFYALNLLAKSAGQLEILLLVLAGPFFLGLLVLGRRDTLPYGLGFCIPFSILVRPGMDMSLPFSVDYTLSSAMAIFVGVCLLYWVFELVEGPSNQLLVRRLFKATTADLAQLKRKSHSADWFNGRMEDRLLRLINYDQRSTTRVVTDLGLTGLNLGHVSIRLHSLCEAIAGGDVKALEKWQAALAKTFIFATKGQHTEEFESACRQLHNELVARVGNSPQTDMIEGMFQRINLSLKRSASMVAEGKP